MGSGFLLQVLASLRAFRFNPSRTKASLLLVILFQSTGTVINGYSRASTFDEAFIKILANHLKAHTSFQETRSCSISKPNFSTNCLKKSQLLARQFYCDLFHKPDHLTNLDNSGINKYEQNTLQKRLNFKCQFP